MMATTTAGNQKGTSAHLATLQADLPYWLVVYRCKGIGSKRFAALLEKEKSLQNCFVGSQPRPDFLQWCQQQGIPSFVADWTGVEQDLAWAQKADCHILPWDHENYPVWLKTIHCPPPLLFVQGDLTALNRPQLAIVGSRHPSHAGKENAYAFAHELAQRGLVITSGLALGIDTASHQGALAAKGATIAVLGNGLDTIYPARNKSLAFALCEKGALVSEFPLGTPPLAEHFPRRNRLISGLSLGVLVVESTLKSGSLITAHYALEQGREIFALPGSIHSPLTKGCHQLIRQGAKCVETVEHIVEELNPAFIKAVPQQLPLFAPEGAALSFTHEQLNLLNQMEDFCTPVDLIVNRTGLTPEKVCSMLLELELQGQLAAVPGGYVRIARGGEAR